MFLLKLKTKVYTEILKKDATHLKIDYCRKKGVKIGGNLKAYSMPLSSEPYLLEFGDNITISSQVVFITHDNSVIKLSDGTDTVGKITIGDNSFLGYRSTFLPGVKIGNNSIVAAGSVVTKSFPQGNVVIGGNPAKVICTTKEYKEKIKNNIFDFKGMNHEQRKQHILSNKEKFLEK